MRIRQSEEFKQEVMQLRKSGMAYGAIAKLKGISRSSVQTICVNSGLFANNPKHDEFFSYHPVCSASTEIVPITLPEPRNTSTDKMISAYEWIADIAAIGTPYTTQKAKEMIAKLVEAYGIEEKVIAAQFTDVKCDRDNIQGMMRAFTITDSITEQSALAERKRTARDTCTLLFGSEEGVFNMLPPEKLLDRQWDKAYLALKAKGVTSKGRDDLWGHDLYTTFYAETCEIINKGMPVPHTIDQVFNEVNYWDELARLRHLAKKEIKDQYGDFWDHISAREEYLKKLMASIKPRNRDERLQMINYLTTGEELNYIDRNRDIMLNVIN